MKPFLQTACIVLFLFVCSISTALAVDDEHSRASLKGLQGIYVIIENLDTPEEQAGLTQADIRTDVELKLRLAGIPVLSEAQWLATPGGPHLAVNVALYAGDNALWSFSIATELSQMVSLERTPAIEVFGSTWSVSSVGSVGKFKVRNVREFVKDQVDKFINAYLAANPKK